MKMIKFMIYYISATRNKNKIRKSELDSPEAMDARQTRRTRARAKAFILGKNLTDTLRV